MAEFGGLFSIALKLMKAQHMGSGTNANVRAALLVAWSVLALAAFLPASSTRVSVHMHLGAFGVMVAALIAATVSAPAKLRWGGPIGTTLRVCWVLMAVSSGAFRGRVDYVHFAAVLGAALACGAAIGFVVKTRKAGRHGQADL
jgi:hypothetical protein